MRKSIGLKILSVALLMALLMAIVAGISSWYLEKIADETVDLVRYHIPIQQDAHRAARAASAELLHFERFLTLKRADASDERLAQERAEIQKRSSEVDHLIGTAISLAQKGERERAISIDTPKFKELVALLPRISAAHREMAATVQNYLDLADQWAPISVAVENQLASQRQEVGMAVNQVTMLLDDMTSNSADEALSLGEKARSFTWAVTGIAALIGLLLAGIITRYLVRPVRELVEGTRAVRDGNLEVRMNIHSADEIGTLAASFNHMVGGLKQKETIQNAFGKYVDPRIVKSLIEEDGLAREGQNREMSVFFSDLQGFTSLCERLSPEMVVRFLNHYFTMMSQPIRAENGIIDKFIGDSVMAFWGTPFVEQEVHALAACRAALAQVARMEAFKRELPALIPGFPQELEIQTRIGISTGEVTVGNIGSDDSKGYTVIGDTVNLAARLESASKQYGTRIIISEDTWVAARHGLDTRELDKIRVVGKREPVRIFEVVALHGESTPAQRELAEMYEAALSDFRAGNIGLARAGFEACLERAPGDKASRAFIDRVDFLERAGVPSSWDGVWSLTQK